MKLSGLTIIAIAAGSLFAAAPAAAQRHVEVQRTVTTERTVNGGYHADRWHHNNNRRHKVCRTRWVNHHRVTRCYWR